MTFRTLISLLVSVSAYEDAAVLSGAAESVRTGFPPFGNDAAMFRDANERMRSELGDAVFRQCADKGSGLTEHEVVRFALDALNRAAPAQPVNRASYEGESMVEVLSDMSE